MGGAVDQFGGWVEDRIEDSTGAGLLYRELVSNPQRKVEKLQAEQKKAQKKLEKKAEDQVTIEKATQERDTMRRRQTSTSSTRESSLVTGNYVPSTLGTAPGKSIIGG